MDISSKIEKESDGCSCSTSATYLQFNKLDVIDELENSDAGAVTGSEALMATGFICQV